MADDRTGSKGSGGRGLAHYVDKEKRLCITVPEAAKMLGISRNFAYELVREHKLPVIHLGKRLLIPRVGLEKMLEQGVNYEGTH
jgi:excisionase family DNA binding protein